MEVGVATAENQEENRRTLLQQALRFATVGGLGAVVDLSTYLLGLHFGLWVLAARTLSFVCGTTTAYVLNRRWTFGAEGGARQATGFALLYGTTFFVIIAVNAAALAVLPEHSWTVTLAWALSQGFGTVCNFVMLRLVVFRS
jgi:putative flippase GtrA